MRNLLQYVYSILVFFGVLSSAYLAINKEASSRSAMTSIQGPSYRSEAAVLDPAVTRLFQMEDALSQLRTSQDAEARKPSRIEIILPAPLSRDF
jgi:hypothetical protein